MTWCSPAGSYTQGSAAGEADAQPSERPRAPSPSPRLSRPACMRSRSASSPSTRASTRAAPKVARSTTANGSSRRSELEGAVRSAIDAPGELRELAGRERVRALALEAHRSRIDCRAPPSGSIRARSGSTAARPWSRSRPPAPGECRRPVGRGALSRLDDFRVQGRLRARGARRIVSAERVRTHRHARQRVRVDRRIAGTHDYSARPATAPRASRATARSARRAAARGSLRRRSCGPLSQPLRNRLPAPALGFRLVREMRNGIPR